MTVCVALEHRFLRLPDGSVWTQVQCDWSFWQRYLEVFDHVRCIARVQDVQSLQGEWHRVDGPGVSVVAVPYYVGPREFLRCAWRVRAAVRGAWTPGEAIMLRVPGVVGGMAFSQLKSLEYPFGVEVIGDPYDALSPGAVRHLLRPVFRWHFTRQLRALCAAACGASYVTARALQRRYPPPSFTIAASSIDLREEAFVPEPRRFSPNQPGVRVVFVGSLQHYHKGPDVLIEAVARAVASGCDLFLTIVGDGALRSDLEQLALRLRCLDRVSFVGQLPSSAIAAELDKADLFVLPSRHEGLPRAMIEAMARALPCIGSDVAGIPELLSPDAIVPAGDLDALTDKIRHVTADPSWMTAMSARNLTEARGYHTTVLQERRTRLYRHVRERTEAWLNTREARTDRTKSHRSPGLSSSNP